MGTIFLIAILLVFGILASMLFIEFSGRSSRKKIFSEKMTAAGFYDPALWLIGDDGRGALALSRKTDKVWIGEFERGELQETVIPGSSVISVDVREETKIEEETRKGNIFFSPSTIHTDRKISVLSRELRITVDSLHRSAYYIRILGDDRRKTEEWVSRINGHIHRTRLARSQEASQSAPLQTAP